MIDKIKALNDFEKQTLVKLLCDFNVSFIDEKSGKDTVSTLIIVHSLDKSQLQLYWAYVLNSKGVYLKKSFDSLCDKVRYDFSNPPIIESDPFDDFTKSENNDR